MSWRLGLIALCALAASLARAEPPRADLALVLRTLAATEALSARFREEKHMALLAQPLVSEGTLYYARPRLLARHTERPQKASLVLAGDVLSFGDAAHTERLALSSQPAVRVLVETFVSVLAGDRTALERAAELRFTPLEGGAFRIDVTPKDAQVKRLVRSLRFEGALTERGTSLSRLEMVDASGDLTVTTFSAVSPRKAFSASERARLFRMGG